MQINYVGDFKLLKQMGYKYQKLYAANYICYHKDGIWIWRKGKELEIEDLYSDSHLVLQYFIDNGFDIDKIMKNHILIVDMANNMLEPYDVYKHEFGFGFNKVKLEDYWETHRKFYISEKIIEPLKELYKKGLIKIQ